MQRTAQSLAFEFRGEESIQQFFARCSTIGVDSVALTDMCRWFDDERKEYFVTPELQAVANRRDVTNSRPRFYCVLANADPAQDHHQKQLDYYYQRLLHTAPKSDHGFLKGLQEDSQHHTYIMAIEGLINVSKKHTDQAKMTGSAIKDREVIACAVCREQSMHDGMDLLYVAVVDSSIPFTTKKFGKGANGEFRRRRLGTVLVSFTQALGYYMNKSIVVRVSKGSVSAGCSAFFRRNGFIEDVASGGFILQQLSAAFPLLHIKSDVPTNQAPVTITQLQDEPPTLTQVSKRVNDVAAPGGLLGNSTKTDTQRTRPLSSTREDTTNLKPSTGSPTSNDEESNQLAAAECPLEEVFGNTTVRPTFSSSSTLDGQKGNANSVTDFANSAVGKQIAALALLQVGGSDVAVGGGLVDSSDDDEPMLLINETCHNCHKPIETMFYGRCVSCGNYVHAICGLDLGHELDGLQQVVCVPCNRGGKEVADALKALQVVMKVSAQTRKRLDIDTKYILSVKRAHVTADNLDKLLVEKFMETRPKNTPNKEKAQPHPHTRMKKKATATKQDWLDFLRQLHFICFEKHNRKASGKLTAGYVGMDADQTLKLHLQTSWVEHKSGLQDLTFSVNETGQGIPFLQHVKASQKVMVEIPKWYREHLRFLCDLEEDPEEVEAYNNCFSTQWTKLKYVRSKKNSDGELQNGYFVLANHDLSQKYRRPPELWMNTILAPITEGESHPDVLAAKKNQGYVELSAGKSKSTTDVEQDCTSIVAPKVCYRQGPNTATCIFSSLASGLYYYGDLAAATLISENALNSLRQSDRLQLANQLLRTKVYKYTPEVFRTDQLDVLNDVSEYPTVCILKGQDGATNHAVTIVGRWIFDSNINRALPLCKASLDWCCSTPDVHVPWVSVHRALRCVNLSKKRKITSC